MASSSSKTQAAPQTRQKRILPSRSRRGGPGVGSCDVDQMILDTYKRQAENEPLIPAATRFLLTTDTSQVPSSSSSSSVTNPGGLRLNLTARERYFDRPEVIKAYKEQLIIQTPEFTNISEDAIVGGRFRPRGAEDAAVDTSDLAYEKRHRKYETFEKRQRLREKEKLKHEQYKLKERIDQLRAMDGAAFMSLPASTFTPPPGVSANGKDSLPGAHINGAAAYHEGERRRKEMLDVASSLEERYRVLLPPDRMKKPPGRPPTVSEPDVAPTSHSDFQVADEPVVEPEPTEKIKFKIKVPPRPNNISAQSSQVVSLSKSQFTATPKKTRHPRTSSKTSEPPVIGAASPASSKAPAEDFLNEQTSVRVIHASSPAYSTPEIAVLEEDTPLVVHIDMPRLIESARPSKRLRSFAPPHRESSLPPIESISAPLPPKRSTPKPSIQPPSDLDRPKSLLLLAAIRQSEMPKSRKTQRHHMAFGFKVPPEVDEQREFELPDWITRIRDVDDAWDHLSNLHGPDQDHPPYEADEQLEGTTTESVHSVK